MVNAFDRTYWYLCGIRSQPSPWRDSHHTKTKLRYLPFCHDTWIHCRCCHFLFPFPFPFWVEITLIPFVWYYHSFIIIYTTTTGWLLPQPSTWILLELYYHINIGPIFPLSCASITTFYTSSMLFLFLSLFLIGEDTCCI